MLIALPEGGGSADLVGRVEAGQTHRFVVSVGQDHTLSANIASPSSGVYLGIVGARDGARLADPATLRTDWVGTVPSAQEYIIDAVGGPEPSDYALIVTVAPPGAAEGMDIVFSGQVQFTDPNYSAEGDTPNVERDYKLYFNADGTMVVTVSEFTVGQKVDFATLTGTWQRTDSGAQVVLTEQYEQPLDPPLNVTLELRDGFLVVTDCGGGECENVEFQFSLGSGDRHPAVKAIQERLAAIPWLEYQIPAEDQDLYGEEMRRAIVKFQESQGLEPDGVVDLATWNALQNPQEPVQPTPVPTPAAPPPSTGSPSTSLPTHTEDGKPILYMTYDDGPAPSYTNQLIEMFGQHNGQATFFVLGTQTEAFPDTIRALASGSHTIGNHTHSHQSLQGMSFEQFSADIKAVENSVVAIAGDLLPADGSGPFLRPPYGATDANTRNYAAQLGYTVVMWDIDPQDWRRPGAGQIADHVIANAFPGAIVLFHDGGGDRTQTMEAMGRILPELAAQGYVFRNLHSP
jgi:peptidoglycan/xylan/chitin deacetylase (PgdA/CDA1 family)